MKPSLLFPVYSVCYQMYYSVIKMHNYSLIAKTILPWTNTDPFINNFLQNNDGNDRLPQQWIVFSSHIIHLYNLFQFFHQKQCRLSNHLFQPHLLWISQIFPSSSRPILPTLLYSRFQLLPATSVRDSDRLPANLHFSFCSLSPEFPSLTPSLQNTFCGLSFLSALIPN